MHAILCRGIRRLFCRHRPAPVHQEARYNVQSALDDHHFVFPLIISRHRNDRYRRLDLVC